MLKKFKVVAFLLCFVMLMTMFAGCGSTTATKDTQGKTGTNAGDSNTKQLIIGFSGDATEGLDVHQISTTPLSVILMTDPLYTINKQTKQIVPVLAESVNFSEDGKTITVKLPEGRTFSNGDPLNAQAVKASFDRMLNISPFKDMYASISKIEAPDDKTVIFTCSQPDASLLTMLSSGSSLIIDAAEAKKVGDQAFNNNPVGSGPYILKQWIKGGDTLLTRNDNYKTNSTLVKNKGPFNFETIKIKIIPNSFSIVNEFLSGNIDILYDVPTESIALLKSKQDITVKEKSDQGFNYLMLNPDRIKDVKVRTALLLATNRDEIQTADPDGSKPVYGPLNPDWIGGDKNAEEQFKKDYAYNLDKAKALLAEAGYKDINGDGIVEKDGKPLELEVLLPNSSSSSTVFGPVLKSQYEKLGIKINIKLGDAAMMSQALAERSFDIKLSGAAFPDAMIFGLMVTTYDLMKGSSDKEKCEKLLTEAQGTLDLSARAAKYTEAAKLLMNHATAIPLFCGYTNIAYRNNIKGLVVSEDGNEGGDIILNDATKE